ncbi:unnamed protein product [marine sediment metagenome]|uniref:Uncharacterized protein n=1 Tax=marine sediment metagenome TaxID=412755 RepID=X0SW55_9ZZZZ
MSGFDGYDQWKTASPFDDEPDFVDEGEDWLKRNEQCANALERNPMTDAYWIIKGLLSYIEEN